MQRIKSFDLARGFFVLLLPSVHVLMAYGNRQVQQSLPGYMFVFIAECTGTQLSMLVMGILFSFSRGPRLIRGLHLILLGFAVNFFTLILPLGLNLLPDQFLYDRGQYDKGSSINFFLFTGNIFHFAGIAWIILYFIFHSPYYAYRALYFTIAILFLSPMFWDIHTGNFISDYFFTFIGGQPPHLYFPVIPWLIFPLAGLTLGYFIKKDPDALPVIGWTGCSLIFISFCFPSTTYSNGWISFYRTKAPDTIFHLGLVLLSLAVFHWITSKIIFKPLFQLLTFCSRNITMIFIIQETLIGWCLPLAGYQTSSLLSTIYWMAALTMITLLMTFLLQPKSR